jgi:heptosyltransferase-2
MLVAAPEGWDEVCFLVPALRAMRAAGLSVGVLCGEDQREFWETVSDVVVLAFPAKTKAKVMAAGLRGEWKAGLVWESGTLTEAMVFAGIPRRLGPQEKKLARQLTHPLAFAEKPLDHRVRFYLSAVEMMGMDTRNPEFFAPVDIGVSPVEGAVLLSPDSDYGPSHEWPLDRWEAVAGKLREEGRRITVAGIDGCRGLGRSLVGRLGDGVEFFQASPLAGAMPLLAVHGLVIAADGSLPHLAGHVGATCFVLFGPNDPAWKRPLGRRHFVVRQPVECAPCLAAKCALDLRCQKELDVHRVLEAIRSRSA